MNMTEKTFDIIVNSLINNKIEAENIMKRNQ